MSVRRLLFLFGFFTLLAHAGALAGPRPSREQGLFDPNNNFEEAPPGDPLGEPPPSVQPDAEENHSAPPSRSQIPRDESRPQFLTYSVPSEGGSTTKIAEDGSSSFGEDPSMSACALAYKRPYDVFPYDLLRAMAFYFQSKDGKECDAAARSIISLAKTFGPNTYSILRSPSYINAPDRFLLRSLVENYINSCTKRFNDPVSRYLVNGDNERRVIENIGVVSSPYAWCMGTILHGKVLTAKHCVVADPSAEQMEFLSPGTKLEFQSLDGKKYDLLLPQAGTSKLQRSERDRDWIWLEAVRPIDVEVPIRFEPSLATLWRPLLLVSLSPYIIALKGKFEVSSSTAVMDIAPACTILATDKLYLFHSCQTVAGMSGSALMTMEGNELVVVGVHAGEVSEITGDPCASKIAGKVHNYGVRPTDVNEVRQ